MSIIVPVTETLAVFDDRFLDMRAARRGSFVILRGKTGAGKSTFLDTIGLFRTGVVTERIPGSDDIVEALSKVHASSSPRVIVLEGREALREISSSALEAAIHAINSFVRSPVGQDTLIVWPTNTDDLTESLSVIAHKLGGESLLGVEEPVTHFYGPSKQNFVSIAERTVAALNEGASLAALGISAERADELANQASTIGLYLALVRKDLIKNGARVRKLLAEEQYKLWTVVIAGNDPEGDVAALTRGGYAYADIDRLMTATGANIVSELKKSPDTLGILGTVLDAKILNIDIVTINAVARHYGDPQLHSLMSARGMSISSDKTAKDRIAGSELGSIMAGNTLGTRKRGSKPRGNTLSAFSNIANIARLNDGALNRAIGSALVDAELALSYTTEKSIGTAPKFFSDLYLTRDTGPLRVEIMWRETTSRAEIANYVLTKLGNYARAIGLLGSAPESGT
ncbi:hypothetical protein [Streptosporangium carneum]|nr:hypothetical protein [Streptosporangium carneum]